MGRLSHRPKKDLANPRLLALPFNFTLTGVAASLLKGWRMVIPGAIPYPATLGEPTLTKNKPIWSAAPTFSLTEGVDSTQSVLVTAGGAAITLAWVSGVIGGSTVLTKPAWITFHDGVAAPTISFSGHVDADDVTSLVLSAQVGAGTPVNSPSGTVTVASSGLGFTVVGSPTVHATLQAAINASVSGDTIIGVPGTYNEWRLVISAKTLTIKSSVVGQKVTIDASAVVDRSNLGIVAVQNGGNLTLEDFHLTGNRWESGNWNSGLTTYNNAGTITLNRCKISECQVGIGSSQDDTTSLWTLTNCEFVDNGDNTTRVHDLYFDACASVTMRGCWVYHTKVGSDYPAGKEWYESAGHLVKSRARTMLIEACRLTMQTDGYLNRCIDYPNGGDLTVKGCLIEYRTRQNNGYGQAISWGVEGANRIPGTTFDARSFNINIQQNTIVGRGTINNRDVFWIGVGCSTANMGITDWSNTAVTPAPSTYSVADNYFCGWDNNPPRVIEGPSAGVTSTYGVSGSSNTCGALTLLTDATTYDYRPSGTPVAGAHWTDYAYSHNPTSYPRTTPRTDSYRGGAIPGDGTVWATAPSTYMGSQTFTKVQGIGDAITTATSGAGGFATLTGTGIASTVINDILPYAQSGSAGYTGPRAGDTGLSGILACFSSSCWNGYGWFHGTVGADANNWSPAMLMVRVADPPGVFNLYDVPGIAAVVASHAETLNGTAYAANAIIAPAHYSLADSNDYAYPEWGPHCVHMFTGMAFDPVTGKAFWGGDLRQKINNPTAIGQTANFTRVAWVFDTNAATPKAAWTSVPVTVHSGEQGHFSAVLHSNSRVSYRGVYAAYAYTIDLTTNTITNGSVTGVPVAKTYKSWQTTVKDEVTGKFYEFGTPINYGDVDYPYIYEVTGGQYTQLYRVPQTSAWSVGNIYGDRLHGLVVRNGIAYIWPTSGARRVLKVDLRQSSGGDVPAQYVEDWIDPAGGSIPTDYNGSNGWGTWQRWQYIPTANCFVLISSINQPVWVFRPPSSWSV